VPSGSLPSDLVAAAAAAAATSAAAATALHDTGGGASTGKTRAAAVAGTLTGDATRARAALRDPASTVPVVHDEEAGHADDPLLGQPDARVIDPKVKAAVEKQQQHWGRTLAIYLLFYTINIVLGSVIAAVSAGNVGSGTWSKERLVFVLSLISTGVTGALKWYDNSGLRQEYDPSNWFGDNKEAQSTWNNLNAFLAAVATFIAGASQLAAGDSTVTAILGVVSAVVHFLLALFDTTTTWTKLTEDANAVGASIKSFW